MATANQYFLGSTGYTSPITLSCQKSFALLATDGNPTSDLSGNMYALSDQQNVYDAAAKTWTFSKAANDVFPQISSLRNISVDGHVHDIQTYVVGLGDTVANPGSIAVLNQFANLGGTKQAYLAQDAGSLASAFQAIAVDIESKTAAASAVSLNAGSWGTGTNLYQARFSSGDWSGQLIAYVVNQDGTLGSQLWDAGQVINGQNWTPGERSYLQALRGAGQPRHPFPLARELPRRAGGYGNGRGAIVAARWRHGGESRWLRRTAGEMDSRRRIERRRTCGTCTPSFRSRPTSKLGDIVHSAPAYVASAFGYADNMEAAHTGVCRRQRQPDPDDHVGANDGMLHGFNAKTGVETLAYVPTPVYRNLSALTTQNITANPGDPAAHHYYVDGSSTVGDVFYNTLAHDACRSPRRRGQGVYALDITDPTKFNQATASSVVRWEFNDSDDADVGYVFGQPPLVKTNNGRWSVIFGNGYNNTDADSSASTTGHACCSCSMRRRSLRAKIDTQAGTRRLRTDCRAL